MQRGQEDLFDHLDFLVESTFESEIRKVDTDYTLTGDVKAKWIFNVVEALKKEASVGNRRYRIVFVNYSAPNLTDMGHFTIGNPICTVYESALCPKGFLEWYVNYQNNTRRVLPIARDVLHERLKHKTKEILSELLEDWANFSVTRNVDARMDEKNFQICLNFQWIEKRLEDP